MFGLTLSARNARRTSWLEDSSSEMNGSFASSSTGQTGPAASGCPLGRTAASASSYKGTQLQPGRAGSVVNARSTLPAPSQVSISW